MNKFNEVAQTVLGEALTKSNLVAWANLTNIYRELSIILSKKGLKPVEHNEVMEAVQKAMKLAFNEGYKTAESNPFK